MERTGSEQLEVADNVGSSESTSISRFYVHMPKTLVDLTLNEGIGLYATVENKGGPHLISPHSPI
jgi:hypothetical protein